MRTLLAPGAGPARHRRPAQPRSLLLVGAHGGAGVSTLTRLLAPAAVDLGAPREWRRIRTPSWQLVGVVTGCTVAATGQAVYQVAAAARAGIVPRVLIVVGDGWPLPGTARARLRLLAAQVGQIVHVPYVPGWRYVEQPDPARLPGAVERALAAVRAAVEQPSRRAE